jgi:hypothetical protein
MPNPLSPLTTPSRQLRLARLEARLARLRAEAAREQRAFSALSQRFHLGTVGGSGKPVARLDRVRGSSLERTIDRAVEMASLERRIAALRCQPIARRAARPRAQAPAAPVTERALHIWNWYHHGDADDEPPYEDISEAELASVRALPVQRIRQSLGKEVAS